MGAGAKGRALIEHARRVAAAVRDPELPALTIEELGILRNVEVRDGTVEVAITPTYSGCPATEMIAAEVERALALAGIGPARVVSALAPAWTSDWITETGRQKLRAAGIAPPGRGVDRAALFGQEPVVCPRCGAAETEQLTAFGSTACKALWRCRSCLEPFEHFKCH
jgi:ring-1,2-phenylacetyl-CoA epoxidase subunit PaaD